MSIYPYNNRKFSGYGAQGSPLNWDEAVALAYKLFRWHSDHETDCWTQSNDGADRTMDRIALGLMAMLAEPGFVGMLEAVGESVGNSIQTVKHLGKKADDDYRQALVRDGVIAPLPGDAEPDEA